MSIFKEELPNRKNKQQNLHDNVNRRVSWHRGATVMMVTGNQKDTGYGGLIKMLVTYTE